MRFFPSFRSGRFLFFSGVLFLFPLHTYSQSYCWPNTQMACFYGDMITRVTFAGIDHFDNVCGTDSHGQKDFTGTVAPGTVTVGQTYSLSVSVENSIGSGTERLRAWIDYNRNGVFEASESIDLGTATGNTTITKTVTVPETASPGTTRMRIMYRRTASNPLNATDACHAYGNYRGQVKDYALRIEYPSPLPVELVSFTCAAVPEGVRLEWETASETNNDFFTVEHSDDAWNWHTLVTLPGAGNSNTPLGYAYTHSTSREGIHYYRLRQTDYDGQSKLYSITGIRVEQRETAVIYPNPCTDFLHIRADLLPLRAQVFTPSGQILSLPLTRLSPNESRIDVRNLAPGMYYLAPDPTSSLHILFIKQ